MNGPQAEAGARGGAFFEVDDPTAGRYRATVATRGPWSEHAQHGGPPMALCGTRMAQAAPEDFRATRLTFEILRPVPIAPLTVTTQVARAGQQAAWIEGAVVADGPRGPVEVMRARGAFVKARPGTPARTGWPAPMLAGPERATPFLASQWGLPWADGYHASMDLAYFGARGEGGRTTAWMRPRIPLIAGEPWTPLGRVLVVVDSIGGACAVLPFQRWTFVNADTTCQLVREPIGEWIALAGTQWVAGDGIGLAQAAIHDATGPIGHGLQSQVVAPR